MKFNKKRKKLSLAKQEAIAGYAFITPFIIGFIFIIALPLILLFTLSFTNLRYLNLWKEVKFAGFNNFIRLFKDSYAIDSLIRSLKYAAMYIPLVVILGLIMALLINKRLYFRNAIRTMLFMPYISNLAAIAIVWSLIFEPAQGPVNMFLRSIGVNNPPMWLVGQYSALPTIVIIVVWQGVGFYFITYLAALQGVPRELHEAAIIDGANSFQRFWNVTLPMISGTTLFLVITAIIQAFQNFSAVYILTRGGPGDASRVMAINIYNEAFLNMQMSYASTQSLVLFAILMVITGILWKIQKKWVYV